MYKNTLEDSVSIKFDSKNTELNINKLKALGHLPRVKS